MTTTTDKLLLFKSHDCSHGLSDAALGEISDAAELVQFDSGEYLHRANQPIASVSFVVHGRLKQSVVDIHGGQLLGRFLTRGSQFGALGAAQADPIPVEVIALEPSAVLKLDFESTLRFTRKYEAFGLNLTQSISKMVSQVLLSGRKQEKPSLVTVIHESPASHPLTSKLIRRLQEIGETPNLISDRPELKQLEAVPFRALTEDGHFLSREQLRRQVNLWSDSGRVIMDADASWNPADVAMLVEFSDQVIWCVEGQDIERTARRLESIESRAPGWRDKISLAWILKPSSWVAPTLEGSRLRDWVDRDFKLSFSEPERDQGRHLQNGLERLVHHLRGIKIGLALGGGGARGMAHIGVLKALEENGIIVDQVAGTSAGAMTGIVYGAGFSADWATNQFTEDLKPGRVFQWLPRGNDWYLIYKYRRSQFDRMLRKYLSDWTLDQLPIPVQSVTVDLVSGKPVVRGHGEAVSSILESINLPVISKPICRNGQVLIDGGLVNNIPADVLLRDGCNFVIAASVTAHLQHEFAENRPDTPTQKMRSPSTLQTMMRSYLVQSVNMNSVGIHPADVVIEPDVTSVNISDFGLTRELAALGEQAALGQISKIKSLLAQLDGQLFPEI